ncbi:O-methyltransferase [Tellurirhabdus rosea]|uniref:O-methyltransferase n=1 Tax=Tellurirhabdus rosea TaxID=2674997 RepID=UPI002256AB7A|nr:class I SAM-dependent methyltransferase [Tellurirhabdus rosea]
MIAAYLRYLLNARDEHSLHSPFLYDLYTKTIRVDEPDEPAFAPIEDLRRELLKSRETIAITDYGAGSKVNASRERTIRDIARHSQKPTRFARLLYRLLRRFECQTVFDLGTSLGLTTLYEAAAVPQGKLITFEGCPQTADRARSHFARLGYSNIQTVVGNLDETLAAQIAAIDRLDFAFFDANHRYEPTVRYFETCLPKIHNDTCFVFDDIHWSAEMEQAWEAIKAHPQVVVTVDLFYVGLVFFRQQQPKQHFTLKF